jgi:hypothetical protein
VIFICMRGGPTHVDTFDYKPALARDDGKTCGFGSRRLARSQWRFRNAGQSGLPISELFPHLAGHADDLCLVNSVTTSVPNHPQAFLTLHTGEFRFTRPSMGSWILYGLGTENQNLPGFISISPPPTLGGAQNYGSAFLPASFQGAPIGQQGTAVAQARVGNTTNALSLSQQRRQLDLLQDMNRDLLGRSEVNPDIDGVINSYELGFRMQSSLPDLMDLSRETQRTRESYGIGGGQTDDFGRQCLMARRLAEAGVRFIEICHNNNWDTHNGASTRVPQLCRQIDQPMAGLLADLKQRGMLDDTLVMWGGEFGRSPPLACGRRTRNRCPLESAPIDTVSIGPREFARTAFSSSFDPETSSRFCTRASRSVRVSEVRAFCSTRISPNGLTFSNTHACMAAIRASRLTKSICSARMPNNRFRSEKTLGIGGVDSTETR